MVTERQICVPASMVSSFVNLHRFKCKYESFACLLSRHYIDSLCHYLTPFQIASRKKKEQKQKNQKDFYLKKAFRGELDMKTIPKYLHAQIRGLVQEAEEGLEGAREIRVPCNGYTIIGSPDGFLDGRVAEFKSRGNYFIQNIRDKIQLCCYCMGTKKDGLLRQRLGKKVRDTVYSYKEMSDFWKEIIPVLDETIAEFRLCLEGKLEPEKRKFVKFWLKRS